MKEKVAYTASSKTKLLQVQFYFFYKTEYDLFLLFCLLFVKIIVNHGNFESRIQPFYIFCRTINE